MSIFFQSDWFVMLFFSVCIFVFSYLNSERIIAFFHDRSLGRREEIIKTMDKMMIDVDRKKVTTALILLSFGSGFVAFLVCWPNILVGLMFGALITVLGGALPQLVMNNLWESRCNRLVDQMIDGMTIMANGVKAGLSLPQSMERVVVNLSGPLAQEFSLVLNKIRLGMSVEESLNEFGERIPRQDVQMFVTAVNILKETGGNLAETFTTIVTTVRERQKVEKKIQALTAQAMMQGVIITLVPFFLLIVFLIVDPNYVKPLFIRPLGWFFLCLMLSLQVIGGVMMRKIVTIKV